MVFLSFPRGKEAIVQDLAQRLEKLGVEAFTSTELPPVAQWDVEIPQALGRASLFVALIGRESEAAHYQRDEVSWAINRFREEGKPQILVVDLDGSYRDRPFGLTGFTGLNATSLSVDAIAEKIAATLDDLPGDARAEAPKPGPPDRGAEVPQRPSTFGDVLHGAALRLDRHEQWYPMLDECRRPECVVFLLHGSQDQNLRLFMERVRRWLSGESGRYHEVLQIPFKVDAVGPPHHVEGWDIHLKKALGGKEGGVEDLLREAARRQPLYLMLRNKPLGDRDFPEEVQRSALLEFLRDRLVRYARKAGEIQPVRLLVAVHHVGEERSLNEELAVARSFSSPQPSDTGSLGRAPAATPPRLRPGSRESWQPVPMAD